MIHQAFQLGLLGTFEASIIISRMPFNKIKSILRAYNLMYAGEIISCEPMFGFLLKIIQEEDSWGMKVIKYVNNLTLSVLALTVNTEKMGKVINNLPMKKVVGLMALIDPTTKIKLLEWIPIKIRKELDQIMELI